MRAPLLAVRDLEVAFAADEGRVRAVAGASLDVPRNRTVALVGESGSGKTVISQAVLGILPRNARIERGSSECTRSSGRQNDGAAAGGPRP